MSVLIICLATFALSWFSLFHLLGAFIDEAPYNVGNVYYVTEIVLTFVIFFIGSNLAIKYAKYQPFLAALPVGITGLVFYYIELGGVSCIGVCGMPLWYDLISFFKHVAASVLASVFFMVNYRANKVIIINDDKDKNSNRSSKFPVIKSVVVVFSLFTVVFLLWGSYLYSTVVENSKVTSLYSGVLKEHRNVTVFLPSGYLQSDKSYDVLYTLDGENFQHNYLAAISAKVLASFGIIPEIIVVSIPSQGMRQRDFRLKGAVDVNGRESSGDATNFYRFIDRELIPIIARDFRTSDRKIIAGHSYGGLFTAYVFTEQRSSFDGYFSFSPSFQDSSTAVTSFKAGLNNSPADNTFIYLNLGLEGGIMRGSFKQVEKAIENNREENIRATVSYFSLPHALIMIPGYFEALADFYQH